MAEPLLQFDIYGHQFEARVSKGGYLAQVDEATRKVVREARAESISRQIKPRYMGRWERARRRLLESDEMSLNHFVSALVPVVTERTSISLNVYRERVDSQHLLEHLSSDAAERVRRLIREGEIDEPHTSLKQLALALDFVDEAAGEDATRWDDLVGWSAQVLDWDDFNEQERDYKLEIAENIALALEQLREGEPWKPALDLAFGSPNNMLYWRTCDDVKQWFASSPDEAREAVLRLVDEGEPLEERLDAFFEALSAEDLASPSLHVSVASYFLMGADPARYVYYQYTAFKDAMELAGYEQPAKDADETETYLHVLEFLDEIEQAVSERGGQPRDLLDLQSVVWVLTKTSLKELDFLPDEQVRELASRRGEALPEGMRGPEGELASPFAEHFEDISEAEWAFRLFRDAAKTLGIDDARDKRLVVSYSPGRRGKPITLIFADWKVCAVRSKQYPGPRVQLAIPSESGASLGLKRTFSFGQRPDEVDVGLHDVELSEARPFEGPLSVAFEEALVAAGQRFENHSASMHARYNEPELKESVFDPAVRHKVLTQGLAPEEQNPPFDIDRAMQGLFLDRASYVEILDLLEEKQNIILQGPPGVGKTFVVKRLAYTLMGEEAPDRVRMVQFHQSYTYEDFIQGYRPTNDAGFQRTDGTFYEFCDRAKADPDNEYVFIIDEINRGNLSKIFGELMMLIEPDKRGNEWQVPLQYAHSEEDTFFVPRNVYLIGMMNTADRSLAMVDYALRRRFAFVDLEPQFNDMFREHLGDMGVADGVVSRIVTRMRALNEEIAEDRTALGPGFRIGHSYFVPRDEGDYGDDWYRRVIKYEIAPLLEEYWFDDHDRVEQHVQMLMAGV
jgi:hypothetical protein